MPDLKCPNCGASASLPLGLTCSDHRPVPVTSEPAIPDELRNAIQRVLCNSGNYPRRIQNHVLGTDMTELIDAVHAAVLARLPGPSAPVEIADRLDWEDYPQTDPAPAAVEHAALPPKIESHDAPTIAWHFTGRNIEAPAMLRAIADRLEHDDAVLIGLWVTGFAHPLDLDIQVVVDAGGVRPGVPGDRDDV